MPAPPPTTTGHWHQEKRRAIGGDTSSGWWQGARRQFHIIYVSVNALAPNQRARTREAVRAVRHVFLDVDQDASEVLTRLSGRDDLPTPSYVLHSSPNRLHVLWQVSGFTTGAVESLQAHLARDLGTDRAGTPCTQMTRLPGFVNYKRRPHVVTVEYGDVIRRFTPADFPPVTAATPLPVAACRRRHGARRVDPRERARRYLAALPPAIAGHHGDRHTFRVCCRLTRGFALSDDEALALLAEWNARCVPPWSERELVDKVRRARRYGREPIGGLLEGPQMRTSRTNARR
jgi:hypothetical protein